jgi:uncharacterized membrane protein
MLDALKVAFGIYFFVLVQFLFVLFFWLIERENLGVKRNKNETAEEKKERKRAVKESRKVSSSGFMFLPQYLNL